MSESSHILVVDSSTPNTQALKATFEPEFLIELPDKLDTKSVQNKVNACAPTAIFINSDEYGDHGCQLIRSLSSKPELAHVPIIAMSSNQAQFVEIETTLLDSAGAWDVIRVPFFRQIAFAKLKQVLSFHGDKPAISPNAPWQPIYQTPLPCAEPVLFVLEDEDEELQQLNHLLAKHFRVSYRKDTEKAINFLSNPDKPTPDIICIDIFIDEDDSGYELYYWLCNQEQYRNTPIVFTSSEWNGDRIARCIDTGAVDFIRKPYTKALASRLNWHLRHAMYLKRFN